MQVRKFYWDKVLKQFQHETQEEITMKQNKYAECIDALERKYKEKFYINYGEFDSMVAYAGLIDMNLYMTETSFLTTHKRCTQ